MQRSKSLLSITMAETGGESRVVYKTYRGMPLSFTH